MTLAEVLQKGFIISYKGVNRKISLKEVALIYKGIKPAKMDRGLFKSISRELKKLLKQHKKGEMFHLSKMTNSLWNSLGGKGHKQKGATFKGKVHDNQEGDRKRTK